MASTSANRGNSRITTAATTLYSDNQSLIAEIRKALSVIRALAVDFEKGNKPEKVKELEEAMLDLLATSNDCTHFSSAIESVGNNYQPKDELTDFKKLLEDEVANMKQDSPSVPQNHPLYRQFKEAIWNVHHAGQPMPGEEQEDIVMTSTESSLLNITCPLSGKPVIELEDPVRSMDCKHIYDKKAVVHYMKSKNSSIQCPVAGCPKKLAAGRVVCDPLLHIEIEEMRSRSTQIIQATIVEDFTELDEGEN
ncbi:E3 SUMO-protein ligase MMS21 isoform X1 [Magnolia sinica]|uniref:E3 SUMO-protein ligase MMS21 isoform X1 n=1 Tax=Magnolia sinica TaxID=86752 RepID=UPI0026584118|nr:E3 SUMO-protein ligase MMS21 isoform X1 [Magnolia sinica]